MRTPRWLIILLVLSWTLNVALAVALYYQSRRPRGGLGGESYPYHPYFSPPWMGERRGMKGPREGFLMREGKEILEPLYQAQHQWVRRFAQCVSQPDIDSATYFQLADSLLSLRAEIHRQMIRLLWKKRGEIPPERWRQMARIIEGPGGWKRKH